MSACPAWKGHGVPVRDYPGADLWCLLQCERTQKAELGEQYGNDAYLANIEAEWSRRNVCSHCFEAMGEDNPPAAVLLQHIKELEEENQDLREQVEHPKPRFGFSA